MIHKVLNFSLPEKYRIIPILITNSYCHQFQPLPYSLYHTQDLNNTLHNFHILPTSYICQHTAEVLSNMEVEQTYQYI